MMRVLPLAMQLMILVHTVDQRNVAINAEQIRSMTSPGSQVTNESHCLIHLGDGHFVNTMETCDMVGELWRREDAKEK